MARSKVDSVSRIAHIQAARIPLCPATPVTVTGSVASSGHSHATAHLRSRSCSIDAHTSLTGTAILSDESVVCSSLKAGAYESHKVLGEQDGLQSIR